MLSDAQIGKEGIGRIWIGRLDEEDVMNSMSKNQEMYGENKYTIRIGKERIQLEKLYRF